MRPMNILYCKTCSMSGESSIIPIIFFTGKDPLLLQTDTVGSSDVEAEVEVEVELGAVEDEEEDEEKLNEADSKLMIFS